MTIDLSFFCHDRIVLRVNMCASNFYDKVCAGISDEEIDFGDTVIIEDEETGDEIFTDKTFVKKIWNACLEYGYISGDYDILGLWVDKLVLR